VTMQPKTGRQSGFPKPPGRGMRHVACAHELVSCMGEKCEPQPSSVFTKNPAQAMGGVKRRLGTTARRAAIRRHGGGRFCKPGTEVPRARSWLALRAMAVEVPDSDEPSPCDGGWRESQSAGSLQSRSAKHAGGIGG